ncbi:MAG: fibronectin type III domain-containing protein, partial [Myxococcota bacterium]|nr:fibronectin type III domain-containing protein [Myxococcota bacterium]
GNPRPVATNIVDGQTMTVGGAPITITYSGNLRPTRAVALLAPGSMTHDFDQGQRYVPLAYTNPSAGTIVVTPPETINRAAPGEYLLHLVSDLGVPSTGIYIKLLPPPACVYAIDGSALSYIEAETPSRQAGPFVTVTDATRSGGAYVQVIPGSGSQLSLPDEASVMWYDVNVLADDNFFLWFLANGPDAASNSFWVSVDGNADSQLSLPAGGGWGWARLSASATTILKGSHTLKIKVRQDGAQIDKVLLTHDPNFVPTGLGGSDLTCNGSPLPPAPTNLAAMAGNAQVSLTWNAAAGASSYTVKRGSITGGPYTDFTQMGITATSFTDTGLTNGTSYFYVVTARNGGGESGNSNEASATPTLPSRPTPPTNVVATPGNGQVSVSWNAVGGATSYSVKRGRTTGGPYTDFTQTGITITNFTNTGLANGTTYFYVVTATNAGGESDISSEVSGTPFLPPPPPPPANLAATAGNGQVSLSWSAAAGATSYTVKRGSTTGGPYTDFIQPGLTTTSFTNTGLANGTAYFYVVTASNSNGESGMSNEASATPILPLPGAPTGVTATPGNTQVMLSWTPVGTAASYTVKRGHTSGGPYTDFIQPGITTTSFTNTGLTNGTPYFFVASATNATGEGPNSTQVSATPAAAGPAISNLVVNDTANSAKWSIQTNFRVGQLAFGDRTYTIDSIAASVLIGKPWIRTAANSRAYTKTSPPLATFVLTGTTVYLAIDKRWNGSNGRPSWLTDTAYVDTGFDVVVRQSSTVALPHRVWKKTGFTSGTTVTLPTIGHSAAPLCYTVIVE